MKWFLSLTLALWAFLPQAANATAIGDQEFTKVIYLESANLSPTPSASNSGRDYESAKPLTDGNLFAVPKNVVISNVYLVVDEAITGLTAFNVGDTDAGSGYIASSSPGNTGEGGLGATGLKYWDLAYKGTYLLNSVLVANHQAAKFYSATGKFITLDTTGTSTGGRARLFIKGYSVGASGL